MNKTEISRRIAALNERVDALARQVIPLIHSPTQQRRYAKAFGFTVSEVPQADR